MGTRKEAINLSRYLDSKSPRVPPMSWLHQTASDAVRDWRVLGTYIGRKTKNGRRSKVTAFVSVVTVKPKTRQIPKSQRIPKRITWRESRQGTGLPTDVVSVGHKSFAYQSGPVIGPGDGAERRDADASLGAAVIHPRLGQCVTTAAHLFDIDTPIGFQLMVKTAGERFKATLARINRDADYALLKPLRSDLTLDNLFRDIERVGAVHVPTPGDIGKTLYMLSYNGKVAKLRCKGISAIVTMPSGERFVDVILTNPATLAGESGSALIDYDRRLWGFLIGMLPGEYSVFLPAHVVLEKESSFLFRG